MSSGEIWLPRINSHLQSETIENETALTSLEQFKVEDKLKQLNDIDAGLQEIMEQQVDHKLPIEQRMMIQAELRVLLNSQKELLNKLAIDLHHKFAHAG